MLVWADEIDLVQDWSDRARSGQPVDEEYRALEARVLGILASWRAPTRVPEMRLPVPITMSRSTAQALRYLATIYPMPDQAPVPDQDPVQD